MCTHSFVRVILHFCATNIRKWVRCIQGLCWSTDKSGGDNHTQYTTQLEWLDMELILIHLLSMFPTEDLLCFTSFTSHFLSYPSSAAWYFCYPESTEQQHGCPGRKWWRNRPTWKEPAAPDNCFCLSKVWEIKKDANASHAGKILNDASWSHQNTYTNNWKYGIYTSIASCMCEWKLDGVWKLPININSCLIYPSGLQDKQHTHVLQINMHLYVCFRPNRICTSVSIQNLHLIIYQYIHVANFMFTLIRLYIIISNSHFCLQLRKIPEPFFAKKKKHAAAKRLWSTEILQQGPHGDVVHLKGPPKKKRPGNQMPWNGLGDQPSKSQAYIFESLICEAGDVQLWWLHGHWGIFSW